MLFACLAYPVSRVVKLAGHCIPNVDAIANPFLALPELGDLTVKPAMLIRNGTNGRIYQLEKADGSLTLLKDVRPGHEWELQFDYDMQSKAYPGEVKLHTVQGRIFMEMPFIAINKATPKKLAPSLRDILYKDMPAWLSSGGERNLTKIKGVVRLIMAEMKRIHDLGIVHGDVKNCNIIIYNDADGRVKIRFIDFSFATHPHEILIDSPYGTPDFSGREMWKHRVATPERDVRALQRIFTELFLMDFFKEIKEWGVLRAEGSGYQFYEPGTTFDDMPAEQLPPNVGMVLGSVVPRNTDQLIAMLGEAEKDNFLELFTARWEKAYQEAHEDLGRQSEMMYEIVKAKVFGPLVYRGLKSGEYRADIVREAKYRREETKKPDGEPEQFNYSWHSKMDYVIERFLEEIEK